MKKNDKTHKLGLKYFLTEYVLKQLVIGIIVSIVGGLGIYVVSLQKDKEERTREYVLNSLYICDEMDKIITNEFFDLLIDSMEIKAKIIQLKIEQEKNKDINSIIKLNNLMFTYFNKYKYSIYSLIPLKKKLDLNMNLLKVYNLKLFNETRENLSKAEWAMVNLRKSNISDAEKSITKGLENLKNIKLSNVPNEKIDLIVSNIMQFKSDDQKGKHMKTYTKNIDSIKQILLKYLEDEQNKNVFKRFFNVMSN